MTELRSTFVDIAKERIRQGELHKAGKFNQVLEDFYVPFDHKLAVLMEEVGEVAHEINEMTGGNVQKDQAFYERLYDELIQVAACSSAWCEGINQGLGR